MGIKRPLMILGSTVGAVAAVLSYHPASSSTSSLAGPQPDAPVDSGINPPKTSAAPTPTSPLSSATQSATPSAEPSAQPSASSKTSANKPVTKQNAKSGASANSTTNNAQSVPTTSTPETTPPPRVAKDQTVTGATAQTRWGPVQVQIIVKDGKIIDAIGLQYPDGDRRSQMISEQALPWLIEETLTEQIADVQIIGGATYTSMGWRQSLASAMQKAGL